MSEESGGVIIASEGGVYFVPMGDLESYRLPVAMADSIRSELGVDEVGGFTFKAPDPNGRNPVPGLIAPVKWNPQLPPLGVIADGMMHTATRW